MAKKTKKKEIEALSTRQLEIAIRQGEDFYDKEYLDYCMYVIENRALPSIIDGLKPGARKIMHSAFHILTESKKSNFMDLVGTSMSYAKYHHGDSSLLSTIKTLSLEYKDNLHPLKIVGSNGDLRSPEGAAPRYLSVRLSPYAKLLLKNESILEYNYDGIIKVEPKHYLPIIPLILATRTSGMGIGFAYALNVSYNPVSIIDECISVVETGMLANDLIPHINQFSGSFHRTAKNRMYAKGRYTIDGNKIQITEFAPNTTLEKIDALFRSMYEKGQIVKLENNSGETLQYDLLMSQTWMDKYGDKPEKIEKLLLIGQFLAKPTLVVLDENNKLTEFSSPEEILRYFAEFREQKYFTLKDQIIAKIKSNIADAEMMRKFIDSYLSGKITISKDTPLSTTIAQMTALEIDESYIDTKISKLTKDEYDRLGEKIDALYVELDITQTTTPKEMYLKDLKELREKLVNDFPFSEYTSDYVSANGQELSDED